MVPYLLEATKLLSGACPLGDLWRLLRLREYGAAGRIVESLGDVKGDTQRSALEVLIGYVNVELLRYLR